MMTAVNEVNMHTLPMVPVSCFTVWYYFVKLCEWYTDDGPVLTVTFIPG